MTKTQNTLPDPYNNELLLDYLEGLVDSGTRTRIDNHLQENKLEQDRFDGLRQLYEEYQGDREKVMEYLDQSQRKAFAAFQSRRLKASSPITPIQVEEDKPSPSTVYRKWIGIAASVTIVATLTYLIFFSPTLDSATEQAITWSQQTYPAPEVVRNSTGTTTENWVEAYDKGQYTKAAQLLEVELNRNTTSTTGKYFFAGICYLQPPVLNLEKAINYLSKASQNDTTYQEQARWYLALAYLQNDQQSAATELLEEIVRDEEYQHIQAQQLLEKLR